MTSRKRDALLKPEESFLGLSAIPTGYEACFAAQNGDLYTLPCAAMMVLASPAGPQPVWIVSGSKAHGCVADFRPNFLGVRNEDDEDGHDYVADARAWAEENKPKRKAKKAARPQAAPAEVVDDDEEDDDEDDEDDDDDDDDDDDKDANGNNPVDRR